MNSARATLFFLGLSAMLLYTVAAACESPGPREEISVRCPTSTAIVGEPFGEMQVTWTASEAMVLPIQPMASSPDLWVEIETPSGKIGPYQKGDVLPSLPERPLFLVKAGDRLQWTIGYGDFSQSLCSPGTYHIRFWYRVNPAWWNYKQLWKGQVTSNEVTIRIDQPTGPDKVLWDRFRAAVPNGSCWQFKNWIENHGGELLTDFPSSTYAGYALLPAGQCIPDPRVFVTDLLSFDSHAQKEPSSANQMSADKKRSLEADQKRADQLTAYLKARPDFPRADCLKLELAGRFAALERYQDAQCLCEEILRNAPESEAGKKAHRLLAYLQGKGWIKE